MAVVSGGTTLIDNGTLDAGVPSGKLTLLSTQTASASASISFTSGIDSTYDSYVFKFINMHPATNTTRLTFNMSTDSGSNYNVTKTTTVFQAYNNEAGNSYGLGYEAARDLAQATGFQDISKTINNGNDECCAGTLQLFNPSSSVFIKHFIARTNSLHAGNHSVDFFIGGYGNTTSAINAVQFKFASGNIDSGTIKMYGVA